ncbi:hypothetical protein B7P43_G05837 [Cryptotermes secundus]|uniref:RING-type E3 ubiquitin transferase n=1 Tax=Cryptotermes secundus TaxID=105785 RepID=A0A2J7QN63_9NEOP|nr:hypothetical protein B7P43_G05837 [Cryptotermes secundus]
MSTVRDCLFNIFAASLHELSRMESQEQDTIQDIIGELECPVCLDYMKPPILVVCTNGHTVCSKCAEQLGEECPTCREPVEMIRNIVLEKVARRVKYPCVNKKWGCYETFTIDDIIDHQSECFYSNRQCPWSAVFRKCAWTGDTKDLKRHLADSHADKTEEVEDGVKLHLSISTYGYRTLFPERIIATLGEMFIYSASFTDNNFYCIVQYVGPKSEASKYNYKFSVSHKEGAEKISFSPIVQTASGVHPTSYTMGTGGSFPGVKRLGREADHSPPSRGQEKWIYTSTPPYVFIA